VLEDVGWPSNIYSFSFKFQHFLSVTSGFCRDADEICALLGCNAEERGSLQHFFVNSVIFFADLSGTQLCC
jgi:hypothetical protein